MSYIQNDAKDFRKKVQDLSSKTDDFLANKGENGLKPFFEIGEAENLRNELNQAKGESDSLSKRIVTPDRKKEFVNFSKNLENKSNEVKNKLDQALKGIRQD